MSTSDSRSERDLSSAFSKSRRSQLLAGQVHSVESDGEAQKGKKQTDERSEESGVCEASEIGESRKEENKHIDKEAQSIVRDDHLNHKAKSAVLRTSARYRRRQHRNSGPSCRLEEEMEELFNVEECHEDEEERVNETDELDERDYNDPESCSVTRRQDGEEFKEVDSEVKTNGANQGDAKEDSEGNEFDEREVDAMSENESELKRDSSSAVNIDAWHPLTLAKRARRTNQTSNLSSLPTGNEPYFNQCSSDAPNRHREDNFPTLRYRHTSGSADLGKTNCSGEASGNMDLSNNDDFISGGMTNNLSGRQDWAEEDFIRTESEANQFGVELFNADSIASVPLGYPHVQTQLLTSLRREKRRYCLKKACSNSSGDLLESTGPGLSGPGGSGNGEVTTNVSRERELRSQFEMRHWRIANADKLNALIDECERILDGRKVFKCKYCGKVYEIKSSMRYHMKIIHLQMHLKTSEMQCRVCGKQFTCISAVNRHQAKCALALSLPVSGSLGLSLSRRGSVAGLASHSFLGANASRAGLVPTDEHKLLASTASLSPNSLVSSSFAYTHQTVPSLATPQVAVSVPMAPLLEFPGSSGEPLLSTLTLAAGISSEDPLRVTPPGPFLADSFSSQPLLYPTSGRPFTSPSLPSSSASAASSASPVPFSASSSSSTSSIAPNTPGSSGPVLTLPSFLSSAVVCQSYMSANAAAAAAAVALAAAAANCPTGNFDATALSRHPSGLGVLLPFATNSVSGPLPS
ncbi:unnamed protein product, partial [Protopolystoma xenopodis]